MKKIRSGISKVKEKIQKTRSVKAKTTIKKNSKPEVSHPTAKSASVSTQAGVNVDTSVLEQQRVEESKFFLGSPAPSVFREEHFVFPDRYGKDRIVLLVRDPYWMYSYWEINQNTIDRFKKEHGEDTINSARMVLRVKDVSNAKADKPNSFFDIDLSPGARNWYVNISNPSASYCVEIGFMTKDGRFIMVMRSNIVVTPRVGVSDVLDEEWMSFDDYEKMYALSGGFGIGLSSGEIKKRVKERMEHWVTSGVPGSLFSQWKKKEETRNFFLWVEAELIVYGATMPDAKLTIQGAPKKLNPDGTFSARFALPNGTQVIPVSGTSADNVDTITITPVVNRETK